MNIEIMIYIYMAVCTAMILFNCVMVLINGRQQRLQQPDHRIVPAVLTQIRRIEEGKSPEADHLPWMEERLRHLSGLRTFDADIEALQKSSPAAAEAYLDTVCRIFPDLAEHYCYHDPLKAAYFAYILHKYHIARRCESEKLQNAMLGLLSSPSVYARENALHVIYDLGDANYTIHALHLLDKHHMFHHPKLIHDGLLEFSGSSKALLAAIWEDFDSFSYEMQTTLVNYIRLSGSRCSRQIFDLMTRPGQDDEVYFACMRYFGRFPSPDAYPLLTEALRNGEGKRWELAAVAASVLRSYPGELTVELLKEALHSPTWYVRYNAAESLEALGVSYADLAAVFEGEDRYAREILQYRLDYRHAREHDDEEEAVSI